MNQVNKIAFLLLLFLKLLGPVGAQDGRIVWIQEAATPIVLPYIDSGIGKAKSLIGKNTDSAILLLENLHVQSFKKNYAFGMAQAMLALGSIYVVEKGEPTRGRLWISRAYGYCIRSEDRDKLLLAKWYNSMGASYGAQGINDSALRYFYTTLKRSRLHERRYRDFLAMVYNNIAFTYYSLRQNQKAIPYLNKIESLALMDRSTERELYKAYCIRATILVEEGQLDRAQTYLNLVNRSRIIMDENIRDLVNSIQGILYFKKKRPYEAIVCLKESLNNKILSISNLNALGSCYVLIKDFRKAEYYFEKAVYQSSLLGLQHPKVLLYNNLAIINDSLGNHTKAYRYLRTAASLEDSLNKAAKSDDIRELETQYRIAVKDREITTKQLQLISAENELNKKNLWIRGIVSIAFMIILAAAFLFQWQRLKLQKANSSKQTEKIRSLKAEMQAEEKERTRIGHQLHDDVMVEFSIVKMNLATLPERHPEFKQVKDFQRIGQQFEQATIKLRQAAHNLIPDALLQEGLISAIQYFCRGTEQTSNIEIKFQYFGTPFLLVADIEIHLYRIVQELVQNVIKHAQASKIMVILEYIGGHLSLTVEDNGSGIQKHENVSTGMGLRGIRQKLLAMKARMNIYNIQPHGTGVHIEIDKPKSQITNDFL